MRDPVQEALGVPTSLINDARAFGFAESRLGAARDCDTAAFFTLGTGVGGAVVVGRRLQLGYGCAGELGHTTVDGSPGAAVCGCGNPGCVEAYVAAPAIARGGRPRDRRGRRRGRARGRRAARSPRSRDAGRWLGVAIANVVLVLNPERVVIGGGLAAGGRPVLGPAREELRRRVRIAAGRRPRSSRPSSATRRARSARRSGARRPARDQDDRDRQLSAARLARARGGDLDAFGPDDVAELQEDAVIAAVHDQVAAGLDVITDGEQTRLDFNLSFYGHLDGIELEERARRAASGPPAHDQRGRHRVTGELAAPRGLGTVAEYERLRRVAPAGPRLKASVPGPYTLSGRLVPNADYPDRWALAEALLPIVRDELVALADAGCEEIGVDEPSMSCYAHREDPERFVDLFNRTVAPVAGRTRISTHLCFGNYKGRAVAPRRYAPMFPAFLGITRRRGARRDGEPRAGRGRGRRRRSPSASTRPSA